MRIKINLNPTMPLKVNNDNVNDNVPIIGLEQVPIPFLTYLKINIDSLRFGLVRWRENRNMKKHKR